MKRWIPTHTITRHKINVNRAQPHSGVTDLVMLTDCGAAYTKAEWDASDAAGYERTDAGEWLFQGEAFAGAIAVYAAVASMTAGKSTYQIAYVREDGEWDIVRKFEAASDAEANAYAERECDNDDWYVLDQYGNNING
jgi:hypothetical protein